MAPLTPRVPLLFALDQQLILSSAALLTSLILVSRETLLQARLLSVALSAVILSLTLVQVQSGGVAILRVGVGARVGVGVSGLGVSLGISLVVDFPLPISFDR